VAYFCEAILLALEESDQAISVAFVNDQEMQRINYCYLQRDYATDVLSFSYKRVVIDGKPFLGEIVIAPAVPMSQASRIRIDMEKEIRKLLLHGILHLLDYDHETDNGRMNRMQSNLMRRVFFMNSPSLVRLKAER
jgi:probable rRNA maturation factor